MKITHVCLTGPYNLNWSYQENIIPKFHKKMGYEVSVLASIYINSTQNMGYDNAEDGEYYTEDTIKVIRIPFKNGPNKKLNEKFRIYEGLHQNLIQENPDIIFIHGCQFWDIREVVDYVKDRDVRVYVDNHADLSNSARNFLSKQILHKLIWRKCAKAILPYTEKFYGVIPARVDFLNTMYGIPKDKIDLLVMGADDDMIIKTKQHYSANQLRNKYGLGSDDFVIVTGGKIDNEKKQTLLLMEAIQNIKDERLKLLVFGSVNEGLKKKVEQLSNDTRIQYIGWIDTEESYAVFEMANLAVFPGRHSVYWEQVVGQGIPLIVKWWEGTTHIDIGGNVRFLYKDTANEIQNMIEELLRKSDEFTEMEKFASSSLKNQFLYSEIARLSIENYS